MTSITFFFLFIPILAMILLAVNLFFAPHNSYEEKNSVFECGFHSFIGQNRTQFSISFFIFALLFLLFDLEILLIYPYAVSSYNNGIYGFILMLIFFLVLTLGFAFELGKKALLIDSRQMFILRSKSSSISTYRSAFYPLNAIISLIYIPDLSVLPPLSDLIPECSFDISSMYALPSLSDIIPDCSFYIPDLSVLPFTVDLITVSILNHVHTLPFMDVFTDNITKLWDLLSVNTVSILTLWEDYRVEGKLVLALILFFNLPSILWYFDYHDDVRRRRPPTDDEMKERLIILESAQLAYNATRNRVSTYDRNYPYYMQLTFIDKEWLHARLQASYPGLYQLIDHPTYGSALVRHSAASLGEHGQAMYPSRALIRDITNS